MSRAAGPPVVAVDVDGVLNPHDPVHAAMLGYRPHHYAGPDPTGAPVAGTEWLHPEHGRWLREITDEGAELVWNTSWASVAAAFIAPCLGLPDNLTVISHQVTGVAWGRQGKLDGLFHYSGDRPVAVLDDEHGGKDPALAAARTAQGLPTLLVAVDPFTGLRRPDIDLVLRWLRHLPTG